MKYPIQTFEPNLVGRDFVIGDLHGSLSCFQNLIKNLNFDTSVDRMFSVGDLVDRGPDSPGCLELLHEPWFHSVLSNHEQMMLEAFYGGFYGNFWLQNGGAWGVEAKNDFHAKARGERNPSGDSLKVIDALPLVQELPYLITIKMKDGKRFHIIHAEMLPPSGVTITDELLEDPVAVHRLATIESSQGEMFTWGRHMFGALHNQDFSNVEKIKRKVAYRYRDSFGWFNDELSHIISGHTIMHAPITIIGQTNIDTCAYSSYERHSPKHNALTCIELDTWTFYQATETIFRTVDPITVNTEDVLRLRPEFTPEKMASLNAPEI